MARRGRNGQLLLQFLPEDLLQDQDVNQDKLKQTTGIVGIDTQKYCKNRVAGVGQNFIIHKFQELMLKKRKHSEIEEESGDPVPVKKRRFEHGHFDSE